jgi:hypothetical protein
LAGSRGDIDHVAKHHPLRLGCRPRRLLDEKVYSPQYSCGGFALSTIAIFFLLMILFLSAVLGPTAFALIRR